MPTRCGSAPPPRRRAATCSRAAPSDFAPAVKSQRPRFHHDAAGSEIFRAAFLSCLDQVLANASNVASGCLDDEVVHQLRIGLRRMRTVWREMPDWRGDLATSWLQPAADVFRALGVDRDRRTVAAAMREPLLEAGSPDPDLRATRDEQPVDVVELVRSKDFQHALLDMLDFALDRPSATEGDDEVRSPPDASAESPRATIGTPPRQAAPPTGARCEALRRAVDRRTAWRSQTAQALALSDGADGALCSASAPSLASWRRSSRRRTNWAATSTLSWRAGLRATLAEAGDGRAWFNVGWLQAREAGAIRRCSVALRDVAEATRVLGPVTERRISAIARS